MNSGTSCAKYGFIIAYMISSLSLFGAPDRVIADQGRCCTSSMFSEFCASQKVQLHFIATGISRANGQVEQVMSILKNLLSVVESSQRSWQDVLGEVQLALNSTISRATEASPLEMLIGKQARPLGLVPPCEPECEIDLAILSVHARRAQKRQVLPLILLNVVFSKQRSSIWVMKCKLGRFDRMCER